MISFAKSTRSLRLMTATQRMNTTTTTTKATTPSFVDYGKERKLSALELQYKWKKGQRIAMITGYDYPTAKHAEQAGFDIILVGDSLGMVVLGYDSTQPVTVEDMIHHSKAVRRGAPSRFIVTDLPFGSYESSPEEALKTAFRIIKETGVDAVKLEGNRAETVRKLADSGVAVMGHVGLTPQSISVLGRFRTHSVPNTTF